MINWQSIKKILESQGKFDFKPLVIDGINKELWAYRTEHNLFVICDADLIEISYSELKLNNIFIILSTDKKYRVLKKGIRISELKKDYPEDTQFDIWIIDHLYSEIIKLNKEINGYNFINNVTFENSYRGSTYIVFEPERLSIKAMMEKSEFWKPKKKLVCYEINDGELKDTGTYYCGTFTFGYSHDAHLFFKDNEYWFNDGGILTTSPRFNEPVIKTLDKGLVIIEIKKIEGAYNLCVYSIYEGWKPGYNFIECRCLGKFSLDLRYKYSITEYYSYNNIILVKFLERVRYKNDRMLLWATFDMEGNFHYQQSTYQKVISFKNGIVKLMSETQGGGEEYEFYDYKGNHIVSFKNSFIPKNHVVIERNFDLSLIRNDAKITEENNTICFKGIMDTRTCELVFPFSHRDLTLYNDFENFYAIFSEEHTGKDGNKHPRYGLIYNGEMILPCYCDKITAISNSIFTFERQGRHGIISNGLIRSKSVYDTIKLFEEVSIYTVFSEITSWSSTYLYKYKHAILYKGIKVGICSPKLNLFLNPTFYQVDFISEHFFLADSMLYIVDDGKITKFKSMEGYEYLGGYATFYGHYHLFYKAGEAILDEDSYFCILLKNDKYDEKVNIVDLEYTSSFTHNDLDDGINNGDIDMDTYGPILCIGSFYYSIIKKIFTDNLKVFTYPMDDNDYYEDGPDYTDYDRETYYALGGDDYDRFKENGGNIDDMMDRMGF